MQTSIPWYPKGPMTQRVPFDPREPFVPFPEGVDLIGACVHWLMEDSRGAWDRVVPRGRRFATEFLVSRLGLEPILWVWSMFSG